jgi:peroxiredoxin Q/BCP
VLILSGTKQACQFRDQYTPLTATGLSIYGLSKDTPKSNSSFKEKQKLPYPLLCDPKGTLIKAITLLKSDGKITRGVFVIDKSGKIFAAEGGSPSGTVDVVERLIKSGELTAGTEADGAIVASKEDVAKAEIAADVADTAEKLDRV